MAEAETTENRAMTLLQDSHATEHVVLVDDLDRPLGTAEKSTVHDADTPLHRGFSVFLFDRRGRLLLQQRSLGKRTWPGVWSNSCCGHPQLHEPTIEAMKRRVREELGLDSVELTMMLPHYRYRAEMDSVVENELCPVAVGRIDQKPTPNPDEVGGIAWMPWPDALEAFQRDTRYSPWCVEEARLLDMDPAFQAFYRDLGR